MEYRETSASFIKTRLRRLVGGVTLLALLASCSENRHGTAEAEFVNAMRKAGYSVEYANAQDNAADAEIQTSLPIGDCLVEFDRINTAESFISFFPSQASGGSYDSQENGLPPQLDATPEELTGIRKPELEALLAEHNDVVLCAK